MALNRSINDQRSSRLSILLSINLYLRFIFRCLSHEFPSDLPTTSIVIVFHNEGNSTLLRTLTSIIIRSPIKYIHEIILVDDASINRGKIYFYIFIFYLFFFIDYLKDTLEVFTKDFPVPVRILRNTDRLGLMKSRLRGK
jgi:polypeptide N-acetylgalactosaminyltransferase